MTSQSTNADISLPPKVSTMVHGAMKEGVLVWWLTLSFTLCGLPSACASLTRGRTGTWMHELAPGCTIGRRQAGGCCVILWLTFCCKTVVRHVPPIEKQCCRPTYSQQQYTITESSKLSEKDSPTPQMQTYRLVKSEQSDVPRLVYCALRSALVVP